MQLHLAITLKQFLIHRFLPQLFPPNFILPVVQTSTPLQPPYHLSAFFLDHIWLDFLINLDEKKLSFWLLASVVFLSVFKLLFPDTGHLLSSEFWFKLLIKLLISHIMFTVRFCRFHIFVFYSKFLCFRSHDNFLHGR